MAVSLNPDIVLIDLSHSAMGSLRTIRRLKQLVPDVPIVTFMPMWLNEANWSDEYSRAVLEAGATICLTKSDLADVLLQTLLELSPSLQDHFEQNIDQGPDVPPVTSAQSMGCFENRRGSDLHM